MIQDDIPDLAKPDERDLVMMKEALAAGLSMADAAGTDKRFLRAAVWHCAVSAILEAAPPDLAIAVLEDRSAAVRGYGINGDSPIRIYSPEDADLRVRHVPTASEILYVHVVPVIDMIDDRGNDGLTAFLITAMTILKDWWGPVHLRRILSEQVRALRHRHYAPIAPSEPIWPNKRKTAAQSQRPDPALPRTLNIFAIVGAASPRWAMTLEATTRGSSRRDTRTISGQGPDRDGAIAQLLDACLEAVDSMGNPHPEDVCTILSDLTDPLVDPATPSEIAEKWGTMIRDRKATWSRPSSDSARLIERARKALDEKSL